MKKITNIILITIGFICVGIGSIGIFLPILPTTPFYLLALACFAKGSKRFHKWFAGTKIYKNHLDSFVKKRSMTRRTKIAILLPVTIMLTLAAVSIPSIHVKITLAALLILKYYYFVCKIKTIKDGDRYDK